MTEKFETEILERLDQLELLVKNGYKELLTTKDVMEMLNISRTSLYRLRDEGILVAYKIYGKVYFKKKEVFAAMDEHLRPTG